MFREQRRQHIFYPLYPPGRMNASSVVLEGSLEVSHGKSVQVDLKMLERYALFPGQIVALEGTNPTGEI